MKKFNEIFIDKTKYVEKIQTSEYEKQGKHIIVDQGQAEIAGYTNREEGLFNEVPVIIFGDHTRLIKYIDEPFFLGADGVKVLRSKEKNANYKYLYYALKSAKIPNTGYNRHFKWLKDVEINYPDSVKQEKIVDILDRVSDVIEKRKAELSYLDDLIKARFVELFGEYYMNHINEKQLDEICDFIDYRGKTPEKSESGIPLITAKNVKDNRFSIEPQEFIPEENYDAVMTRGIPRVNDVLFTTEAPLGNVCRIPDIYERFCVGQRLITMQPHTDVINSEYLEHALASAEFQEKMWQKSSGSTVKGIRSKLLVLLTIPVPPIELQNQFRDFVHQVDKSKSAVKKALDETQLLFDSLMQEYFD